MKIMKTIKTVLVATVFFAFFATSCSKKDDPTPPVVVIPTQDPLAGYLAASGFDQKLTLFLTLVIMNLGIPSFR
jgi:hypothetical protein